MTRHSHSYRTTRKARNTGQWWKTKQQRIAERKSVRRHFAHWTAKAHNPARYPNGTDDVPHTPPVERLPALFQAHIASWSCA